MLARECEGTVVAGVNVTLSALTTALFRKAGMLAEDGRCKTLDARADGYVRGEALGVIHAAASGGGAEDGGGRVLLQGSSVNQDGRSSTLTAPNGPSQQRVLRAALRHGALSAGEVSALEMARMFDVSPPAMSVRISWILEGHRDK